MYVYVIYLLLGCMRAYKFGMFKSINWLYFILFPTDFLNIKSFYASISSIQFSCLVMSNSLQPHGLEHVRLSCPSPPPRACSNSCPSSQWCYLTISSSVPLSSAFNLSQHQGLFQWVSFSHQVAKVLELQLQHQSFQWIFRTDFIYDWLFWFSCSPSMHP